MCYYDHAVLMSLKLDPCSSGHVAGSEPNRRIFHKERGLDERQVRAHRRPPLPLISIANTLRLLPGF